MITFLAEHASWIPVIGPLLAGAGALLPRWWKLAAIGLVVLVAGGAALWVRGTLADQRATIARQQADLVTVALQRDQERATAEAWRAEAAVLEKRIAREAAARERERRTLRSAIQSRDKILDEVRREKTARDAAPGAWRPALRRVQ